MHTPPTHTFLVRRTFFTLTGLPSGPTASWLPSAWPSLPARAARLGLASSASSAEPGDPSAAFVAAAAAAAALPRRLGLGLGFAGVVSAAAMPSAAASASAASVVAGGCFLARERFLGAAVAAAASSAPVAACSALSSMPSAGLGVATFLLLARRLLAGGLSSPATAGRPVASATAFRRLLSSCCVSAKALAVGCCLRRFLLLAGSAGTALPFCNSCSSLTAGSTFSSPKGSLRLTDSWRCIVLVGLALGTVTDSLRTTLPTTDGRLPSSTVGTRAKSATERRRAATVCRLHAQVDPRSSSCHKWCKFVRCLQAISHPARSQPKLRPSKFMQLHAGAGNG